MRRIGLAAASRATTSRIARCPSSPRTTPTRSERSCRCRRVALKAALTMRKRCWALPTPRTAHVRRRPPCRRAARAHVGLRHLRRPRSRRYVPHRRGRDAVGRRGPHDQGEPSHRIGVDVHPVDLEGEDPARVVRPARRARDHPAVSANRARVVHPGARRAQSHDAHPPARSPCAGGCAHQARTHGLGAPPRRPAPESPRGLRPMGGSVARRPRVVLAGHRASQARSERRADARRRRAATHLGFIDLARPCAVQGARPDVQRESSARCRCDCRRRMRACLRSGSPSPRSCSPARSSS